MSGASSGACLGHHLGHVWDNIWGILSTMDNNPQCYMHLWCRFCKMFTKRSLFCPVIIWGYSHSFTYIKTICMIFCWKLNLKNVFGTPYSALLVTENGIFELRAGFAFYPTLVSSICCDIYLFVRDISFRLTNGGTPNRVWWSVPNTINPLNCLIPILK